MDRQMLEGIGSSYSRCSPIDILDKFLKLLKNLPKVPVLGH